MIPNSAATSGAAKPYAYEAAKKALAEHLIRRAIPGEIVHGDWRGYYRVRFNLEGTEKVSIIISNPSKLDALAACIKSIGEKTAYRNFEVIVTGDRCLEADTRKFLESRGCRIISIDESSSPSKRINVGAAQAQGAYLLLLHGDTEVISADWIVSMLGFCRQQGIGAVGAKLFDRTGRIQHIGVVLGLKGVAGYPLRGFSARPLGYPDPREFTRNCSAVSAACMMVRKEVFERVGGFDEQLAGSYDDFDFCLRLQEAGYRIVWTPEAQLYHDGPLANNSVDRGQEAYFKRRWAKILEHDPYYNPNLTLRYEDLGYRV
jgi:GT2 family glycosyltransferase